MSEKALTVAIAGALAAPLAAQAVDFTLSGHVNRALFITDNDAGTEASVKDNGSSGTRIRVTGSSELEAGGAAGVNLEYGAGSTLSLRYGEVWYGGEFGKVSIGQGDQGGEGSVYPGQNAAVWIAHGQDKGASTLGDYFGSLDGGAGRNERIRYDTPSVGPLSAAVSVGNGDQVSAGVTLSQDIAGTAFSAKLGTVQWPGDKGTLSASAGVKLPAGLIISGAWGKGKHYAGTPIPAVEGTPGTCPPSLPNVQVGGHRPDEESIALVQANGTSNGTLGDATDQTFHGMRVTQLPDHHQQRQRCRHRQRGSNRRRPRKTGAEAQLMDAVRRPSSANPLPPVRTNGSLIG